MRGKEAIQVLRGRLIQDKRQIKWFDLDKDRHINKRIRECDGALRIIKQWREEKICS